MKEKEKTDKIETDIEIKIGEGFIKIPNNKETIIKLKNILIVLESSFEEGKEIEVSRPLIEEKKEKIEKEEFNKIEDIPKYCPLCNKKTKKGKIKQEGDILIQSVKCRGWSCPYKKDFKILI